MEEREKGPPAPAARDWPVLGQSLTAGRDRPTHRWPRLFKRLRSSSPLPLHVWVPPPNYFYFIRECESAPRTLPTGPQGGCAQYLGGTGARAGLRGPHQGSGAWGVARQSRQGLGWPQASLGEGWGPGVGGGDVAFSSCRALPVGQEAWAPHSRDESSVGRGPGPTWPSWASGHQRRLRPAARLCSACRLLLACALDPREPGTSSVPEGGNRLWWPAALCPPCHQTSPRPGPPPSPFPRGPWALVLWARTAAAWPTPSWWN